MEPVIEMKLARSLVLDWDKLKDFLGSVAITLTIANSENPYRPLSRDIQLNDYKGLRKLAEPLAIAYMRAFLNTVEKNPMAAVKFLENLNRQRSRNKQKIILKGKLSLRMKRV